MLRINNIGWFKVSVVSVVSTAEMSKDREGFVCGNTYSRLVEASSHATIKNVCSVSL